MANTATDDGAINYNSTKRSISSSGNTSRLTSWNHSLKHLLENTDLVLEKTRADVERANNVLESINTTSAAILRSIRPFK